MKLKTLRNAVAATAFALTAMPASAVVVNVTGGSITLPDNLNLDIAAVYENIVFAVGDTLRGVGNVLQINGVPIANLCSSACEMTFRFNNYITSTFSLLTNAFTGGTMEVYLAFGANVDFNPFVSASSAADLAAATNGDLFLTLAGHANDALGQTLVANGAFAPPAIVVFSGSGLLDVTAGAGAANANFDTNTIPALFGGPADLLFTSIGGFDAVNGATVHPAECVASGAPAGPECISASATITGFVTAVPEPGTLALLGLGLGGLGFSLRRRIIEK